MENKTKNSIFEGNNKIGLFQTKNMITETKNNNGKA